MYKKKIDSLENLLLIPPTDNMIERLIYSQQLKNFVNSGCTVTRGHKKLFWPQNLSQGQKTTLFTVCIIGLME